VTVVVAAGNSAFEALFFTPANCVYSLTVSAFVDLNGNDTASGLVTINGIVEYDETFANSFSNWSDYCWDMNNDGFCTEVDSLVVNLMGPGVEIESAFPHYPVTIPGNDYETLTGTSMAAPHVAGTAALYLENHSGATPEDVRSALTTDGECMVGAPGSTYDLQCSPAWPDDPDFAWEPLVDTNGL
jgi:subtilisin family serine protease